MVSNRKARVLVWRALIERNLLRLLKERGRVPFNTDGCRVIVEGIELTFKAEPRHVPITFTIEDPKDDI